MGKPSIIILGIESSCDDTAAAILENGRVLSNIVANQEVHRTYGGVVPELASRAHQQNIVPVIHAAIEQAKIKKEDINAVAFTRGPGLMGSLLVGCSFAKAYAQASELPLIEVNHMEAHVLAHFIEKTEKASHPSFPFLCLTVSGGHTQIVLVKDYRSMEVIGETTDDAAGECFDKAAKILGLPYPGGPLIDKYAKEGNPDRFTFPLPRIKELDFSFSGLKTAFLYFIEKNIRQDETFIQKNLADICASYQHIIIKVLIDKLEEASGKMNIKTIAIAGGVSANSALRSQLKLKSQQLGWTVFIPPIEYCTDNAAMIAIAGYFKYQQKDFVGQEISALARYEMK